MKRIIFIIIFMGLCPALGVAQGQLQVKVSPFVINGPGSAQYLSKATQDAVVGSLIQTGQVANALNKTIDPDKLRSTRQGGKLTGLLLTGRVNVVGQTYRIFLRWVDVQGKVQQEYLQVSGLDELLPKLESFAAKRLKVPATSLSKKTDKELKKTTWEKEIVPAPVPVKTVSKEPKEHLARPPLDLSQQNDKSYIPPTTKKKKRALKAEPTQNLRDYDFVSKRLPFEVRGLAYADVNQDGKKELLLTSQRKLYLYSFIDGQMALLAEYSGAKLDYFVKVSVLTRPGQQSLVLLTNLRGDYVSSKVLSYSGGQFTVLQDGVPFMLRVIEANGQNQIVGAPYNGNSEKAGQNIQRLAWDGTRIKNEGKIKLPWGTHLYNYEWISANASSGKNIVILSGMGKLRFYRQDNKKFKKAWTSRGSYGGTGNFVPVDVKNFFNEVVSDYYGVPVGLQTLSQGSNSEILVVKNSSLVKSVVGRVPIIADGQIFRLSYDEMGFVEAWASKKVDGSIQDYLVTDDGGKRQLMAAVRLRDPGLFGEVGRNDSVILLYNLN